MAEIALQSVNLRSIQPEPRQTVSGCGVRGSAPALQRTSTVSVIATVLNEVDDIDRLVASLAGQTLVPAEIIIVDGGSTDGTWERLQADASKYPILKPIRDESCSLNATPGPIARGRNTAIAAASSEVIACADAGCVYEREWVERLTEPIVSGHAEYALGGSCLDAEEQTAWDIASAPFFGIKLDPNQKTKSCTARSMAFRRSLWQRVGGFPETSLTEDSLFDQRVRGIVQPAFPDRAKAHYRPRHTLQTALRDLGRYATLDGVMSIRRGRLLRNLARCLAEVAAIVLVPRTFLPLVGVLTLEVYFAFRLDWNSFPGKASIRRLSARFFFSLIVPWLVTISHIRGAITKTNRPNRQNMAGWGRGSGARRSCFATLVLKAIAHQVVYRNQAVGPDDLLALGVGAAVIDDWYFVDANSQLRQLHRHLGFDAEAVGP